VEPPRAQECIVVRVERLQLLRRRVQPIPVPKAALDPLQGDAIHRGLPTAAGVQVHGSTCEERAVRARLDGQGGKLGTGKRLSVQFILDGTGLGIGAKNVREPEQVP